MLTADQVIEKFKAYLTDHSLLKHYVLEAAQMCSLRVPAYVTDQLDHSALKADQHTNKILIRTRNLDVTAYTAERVSGGGDCFFPTVSLALYGTEIYSSLLRLKTLIYMGRNYGSLGRDYFKKFSYTWAHTATVSA